MKDARRAKIEQELASAEAELRAMLLRVLPAAVRDGAQVFLNSEHNPHGYPPHWYSQHSEPLLQQARACERLRQQLGLPAEGSLAHLYRTACAEAISEDEHRRGPRRLAEWLLGELSKRQ